MKKKYKMLIAILLALIIILLLGFLFLQKTNSTGNHVKSETTKNSKTDIKKDVSDSKYTIPSEYLGNWYQKDQKTKITKSSVQMATDPDHTITKNSKPMPLDVHKQNGFQYFWQGALMKIDGSYEWKKDGDGMPFWIAKMTINGKKQNVLVSMQHDFISIWTEKPTSKDYSFNLANGVRIPTKPILDLDSYAKNGTSKEDINKQSDSDNGLTQSEAQKLAPGAIEKFMNKKYTVKPLNSKYNSDGWQFSIDGNDKVHISAYKVKNSNDIAFLFYHLNAGGMYTQDPGGEDQVIYQKSTGKYFARHDYPGNAEIQIPDDQNSDSKANDNSSSKDNSSSTANVISDDEGMELLAKAGYHQQKALYGMLFTDKGPYGNGGREYGWDATGEIYVIPDPNDSSKAIVKPEQHQVAGAQIPEKVVDR